MTSNAVAAETASFSRNAYRANQTKTGGGYNVYMGETGMVIMGIQMQWAAKAAALLNVCGSREEQMIELTRIRAAIAAA